MEMLLNFARWDERLVHLITRDPRLLQKVVDRVVGNFDVGSPTPHNNTTSTSTSTTTSGDAAAAVTAAPKPQSAGKKSVVDPLACNFLARAIWYPEVQEAMKPIFIPLASKLSRYEDWRSGSALSELFSVYSIPDETHLELFNYSESYRHLILGRSLLAQRAVLKLLAFLFSNDFLQDAVAVLQYKSDILNHINRAYVDTPDFVSWRYSVRVMSLAGGYNEDRTDVERTDRMCQYVTRAVPEFLLYFTTAFAYGMFRYFPKRAKGKIPKWLRRRRAIWSGLVCGALGVYANTYCRMRLEKLRKQFDFLRHQELRRRRGAERKQIPYQHNTYFETNEHISRKIWMRQVRDYSTVAGLLVVSCIQIPKFKWPAFMGDVVFNYPIMPTIFPTAVNLPCTSRSFIPYIVVPFVAASAVLRYAQQPIYDWYVHQRYSWWRRYRSADFLEW